MLSDRIYELNSLYLDTPVLKDDVLNEAAKGNSVTEEVSLTIPHIIGITAARVKDVNQTSNEVTDNGVGLYGLSIAQLQLIGIVKPQIDYTVEPDIILSDASVFTGRNEIGSLSDITSNERMQYKFLQSTLHLTLRELIQKGILSSDDDVATQSAVAGVSTKYRVSEIIEWVNGTLSIELHNDINKVAKQAQYAVTLVNDKVTDEITKIQAGITGAMVIVPTHNTGTIDTREADAAINSLLGELNIAPIVSDYKDKDDGDIF